MNVYNVSHLRPPPPPPAAGLSLFNKDWKNEDKTSLCLCCGVGLALPDVAPAPSGLVGRLPINLSPEPSKGLDLSVDVFCLV